MHNRKVNTCCHKSDLWFIWVYGHRDWVIGNADPCPLSKLSIISMSASELDHRAMEESGLVTWHQGEEGQLAWSHSCRLKNIQACNQICLATDRFLLTDIMYYYRYQSCSLPTCRRLPVPVPNLYSIHPGTSKMEENASAQPSVYAQSGYMYTRL